MSQSRPKLLVFSLHENFFTDWRAESEFLAADTTNVIDGKNKRWFHSSKPRLTPSVQSVSSVVNFI